MQLPFSSKTLARCVALALVAAPAFAGEIQSISGANLVPNDTLNITTIYDRDVTGGTTGAITNGLIAWDEVKAVVPGIAVYNNVPPNPGNENQIIADCVMAPRVYSLTGDVDKACNDGFQTHKRYKMNATSVGPIDLVFTVAAADSANGTVDQDANLNAYRMIGKLNNHTGKRLGGFKVQLGFGVGSGFFDSKAGDGVKFRLYEEGGDPAASYGDNDIAEFPGGLFYGPADKNHTWGFFSSTRAYFTVNTGALATDEDFMTSTTLSDNYTSKFGEWLPITWVPAGWFHDVDGNPATDDQIVAWFDGTNWLTYIIVDQTTGDRTEQIVDAATITMYENTPSTVWLDDGDGETTNAGETLYATWDAENSVYTLAAGGTATNEDMAAELLANPLLERRAGYKTGPVEDLANVNLNYFIETSGNIQSWPTYDMFKGTSTFTLRITPVEAADNSLPPWPVEDTTTDDSASVATGDGGGCTMATGKAPFDPTLPLLLAGGVAAIALRRRASR